MTRVDFYVLSGADPIARLNLVCKLAEKASGLGRRVFIYGREQDELVELDRLLWEFRAISFVAHRLIDPDHALSQSDNDPVLLSSGQPGIDRNVLVNLDKTVPSFFSRFERTLEIVNQQPDLQQAGRERYLFYKQRGYPLQHHAM